MKSFHYGSCGSQNVLEIKKRFKKEANNEDAKTDYEALLEDTATAKENIEGCLNSETELSTRLEKIKTGDLSVFDDMLGTVQSGTNGSHYRAYLALDGQNIIELRISNHFETKKKALKKSNNLSQFLFQVILVTNPPLPQAKGAITSDAEKVGNLRLLTKKLITSDSSLTELSNVLESIHDYLANPSNSYDSAATKPTISESRLKELISESIKHVLNEKLIIRNNTQR